MTVQIEKRAHTERRGRSLGMIAKLVEARSSMLTLYSHLGRAKPFTSNPEVGPLLEEFCESLIDYAANAHFQLYRYFAENNERRKEILDVAERVYPRIMEITNVILDFNDKYDCRDQCHHLEALEHDLSILGEYLADRIELEDTLISAFGYNLGR